MKTGVIQSHPVIPRVRGELTVTKAGKVQEIIQVDTDVYAFHSDLADMQKLHGWKSSSVFYMGGDIDVKLDGKSYGVKAQITGKLTTQNK